ncbi:MAG: hypothetical protein KAG37_09840 [Flavobacteriales bacterium]|nr:hypothetical protein [Flavobacteriales bacterium]
MNTNKNLLKTCLNSVIDFTTDLLEHDYPKTDILKYGLGFIYNMKQRKNLSTEDYIELESNYLLKIIAVS